MLQNGVINTTQFNDTYARPNSAYGITPLPSANFSGWDAENFLKPIPWRTSRFLPYGITLFSAILTFMSISQLVAAIRSEERTDTA